MFGDLASSDEIDRSVDRLLRAADAYGRFPTPVDDLVRAANLAQADDFVLDESFIVKAADHLRLLLRSAKRKIQGIIDRRARVVHVSPEIENEGKRRFVMLHETAHDIIPHQQDLLYADSHETLAPTTKHLFEQEANQGAAELLFQRTWFEKDADDLEVSMAAIQYLANRYGSSFHSAFRRYAETVSFPVAAIVLGRNPLRLTPKTWKREEVMATPSWQRRFGRPTWPRAIEATSHPFVAALDYPALDEFGLVDLNAATANVRVETHLNGYKRFLLLWVPKRKLLAARKLRVLERW
ncbi:MAG: ImmA/IrrE family metallo-endopeptidase [Nocardioidaceae bacterium]